MPCCAAQANGEGGTGHVVRFAPVGAPPTPPTPPGTTSLRAKSDKLSRRCSNLDDACLLDIKSCASLARADTACTMSTWRGLAPYAGKLGALLAQEAVLAMAIASWSHSKSPNTMGLFSKQPAGLCFASVEGCCGAVSSFLGVQPPSRRRSRTGPSHGTCCCGHLRRQWRTAWRHQRCRPWPASRYLTGWGCRPPQPGGGRCRRRSAMLARWALARHTCMGLCGVLLAEMGGALS